MNPSSVRSSGRSRGCACPPVFVHPAHVAAGNRLQRHYLENLIGSSLDLAIRIASLIFGGILDAFPGMDMVFAHGVVVASIPAGRWNHGHGVRPECDALARKPVECLRDLDAITRGARTPSRTCAAGLPPDFTTSERTRSAVRPLRQRGPAMSETPYRDILHEVRDGVSWTTINRPQARNVFREQTLDEMIDALRAMRNDPVIACAVVTGVGDKAFSADGDFHAMMRLDRANAVHWNDRMLGLAMAIKRPVDSGYRHGERIGGRARIRALVRSRHCFRQRRFRSDRGAGRCAA